MLRQWYDGTRLLMGLLFMVIFCRRREKHSWQIYGQLSSWTSSWTVYFITNEQQHTCISYSITFPVLSFSFLSKVFFFCWVQFRCVTQLYDEYLVCVSTATNVVITARITRTRFSDGFNHQDNRHFKTPRMPARTYTYTSTHVH